MGKFFATIVAIPVVILVIVFRVFEVAFEILRPALSYIFRLH